MVPESSVPKGLQVSFPSPSAEAQPRCGGILDRVKRFTILVPRARPAPDGRQSGGSPPTDIRVIHRRLYWLRLCQWTA
jgi:hypothetical protein